MAQQYALHLTDSGSSFDLNDFLRPILISCQRQRPVNLSNTFAPIKKETMTRAIWLSVARCSESSHGILKLGNHDRYLVNPIVFNLLAYLQLSHRTFSLNLLTHFYFHKCYLKEEALITNLFRRTFL